MIVVSYAIRIVVQQDNHVHAYCCLLFAKKTSEYHQERPIGTALANSVESDLGYESRVYFDNQKTCQHINKCDFSETKGYNIPQ